MKWVKREICFSGKGGLLFKSTHEAVFKRDKTLYAPGYYKGILVVINNNSCTIQKDMLILSKDFKQIKPHVFYVKVKTVIGKIKKMLWNQ